MRGAARIIAGEHPRLWGGLIDISADAAVQRAADEMLVQLGQATGEDIIAVTANTTVVPRLSSMDDAVQDMQPHGRLCRPDSTYLITGGLGGLGLLTARWLAGQGARRLVLAGRKGLPPRQEWDNAADAPTRQCIDAVRGLEDAGVTVRVVAVDVADGERAAAALDTTVLDLPPIRGVIHAAGVQHGQRLEHTDRASLSAALRPKANGLMVIDQLFPPGALDFLILYSSSGQLAGVTGQAGYAAANAFLDAFAEYRAAGGDRGTLSIGWMTWHGVGMAHAAAAGSLEAAEQGLGGIDADQAFQALNVARRHGTPYAAVFHPLPPTTAQIRPLLQDVTTPGQLGDAGADPQAQPIAELEALPAAERAELFRRELPELVAAELGLPPDTISQRRPLADLGMDSVMTVALRAKLRRRYGVELSRSALWNRPCITDLIEQLNAALDDAAAPGPQQR